MTQAIWKFHLEIEREQVVEMPPGARLLSVAEQHGKLCLWASVCSTGERAKRKILVVGTGHPLDHGMKYYVGTAVMSSGLVWHVFDGGVLAAEANET